MQMWPLIDPVTAALLALGIAGVLVHALRPVLLLTLAGFAVHVLGTLVLTGNFDVARVGGSAGYVYVLAGIGAAGVTGSLTAAWGRVGRALALAALAAADRGAAVWNTSHLSTFWGSTEVRRPTATTSPTCRSGCATTAAPTSACSVWRGQYTQAIRNHDGIWLLGGAVPGQLTSDVETALRAWPQEPGPTLFVLFVERNTDDVAAYLQWLLPDLTFSFDRDPLEMGGDVAYAHLPGMPRRPRRAARRHRLQRGDGGFHACTGRTPTTPSRTSAPWCRSSIAASGPTRSCNRCRGCWRRACPSASPRRSPSPPAASTASGSTAYGGAATLLIDGQRRDGHGFRGGDAHARSARARRRGPVLADHAVDRPALERSRHAGPPGAAAALPHRRDGGGLSLPQGGSGWCAVRRYSSRRWPPSCCWRCSCGSGSSRTFPPAFTSDEAGNGYNAYALGTAGIDENGTTLPLYVWSFGTAYKNPLFIYARSCR
jgi:hypothetical protein